MEKLEKIKKIYSNTGNSEDAMAMSAYLRNKFKFYGIKTPLRREISKDIIHELKKEKEIDWDLVFQCYKEEEREMHYFALDYLDKIKKKLTFEDIPNLFKLIKSNQWWDTIDRLDRLVGNIGLRDERVNEIVLDWSTNEDFWVRRVSIDHQLGRKDLTNTELLEKIIVNNFGGKEFFINKAIGWSLRDYSKTNPDWVRDFIIRYKDKMHSLSIKEASKYVNFEE